MVNATQYRRLPGGSALPALLFCALFICCYTGVAQAQDDYSFGLNFDDLAVADAPPPAPRAGPNTEENFAGLSLDKASARQAATLYAALKSVSLSRSQTAPADLLPSLSKIVRRRL